MIELPEAAVIAAQISASLSGKRIAEANQGNSPHKFAFYTGDAELYDRVLKNKVITGATPNGRTLRVELDSGHLLVLGEGGEQILYHTDEKTIPAKRQLWLSFTDGTCLTVSIQGWGAALLFGPGEIENHEFARTKGISPFEERFTYEYFLELLGTLKENDPTTAKPFLITKPGVAGIGNGYLQDILFVASISPRRRMLTLTGDEKRQLYEAVTRVLRQATAQGGRDTERDLFGQPGGYRKLLDNRSEGQPCPRCGEKIIKESYLGGAVYYCPACQK